MPNCFVAMGFGRKTAFYLGKKKPRVLDLDKTYENIIRPAVTAADLECVRADEIPHSTLIGLPMYQQCEALHIRHKFPRGSVGRGLEP